MTVEHRVVIKTRHGVVRRIEVPKKGGRQGAIEVGKVYVDSATPFYAGSNVTVQCREVSDWHDIELEECEEV
jgi:hypothetical protein